MDEAICQVSPLLLTFEIEDGRRGPEKAVGGFPLPIETTFTGPGPGSGTRDGECVHNAFFTQRGAKGGKESRGEEDRSELLIT